MSSFATEHSGFHVPYTLLAARAGDATLNEGQEANTTMSELEGRTIVNVREPNENEEEMFNAGRGHNAVVLELDDGSTIIPAADASFNGLGHIITEKDGDLISIFK